MIKAGFFVWGETMTGHKSWENICLLKEWLRRFKLVAWNNAQK